MLPLVVKGANAEDVGSCETNMVATKIDKEDEDRPHMILMFDLINSTDAFGVFSRLFSFVSSLFDVIP